MIIYIYIYDYTYIYIYHICGDICSDPFASCRWPRNDQLEFHPPIMTNPSLTWGQKKNRSSTKSGLTWGCLCLSRGQGFATLNPTVLGLSESMDL